jgi:hypothetical protein
MLVEQGLRKIVDDEKRRRSKFLLRPAAFHGNGLRPEVAGLNWTSIRSIAYGEQSD